MEKAHAFTRLAPHFDLGTRRGHQPLKTLRLVRLPAQLIKRHMVTLLIHSCMRILHILAFRCRNLYIDSLWFLLCFTQMSNGVEQWVKYSIDWDKEDCQPTENTVEMTWIIDHRTFQSFHKAKKKNTCFMTWNSYCLDHFVTLSSKCNSCVWSFICLLKWKHK